MKWSLRNGYNLAKEMDGEINYSFNLNLCKADVELGIASSPVLAFTNPAKKLN